MIETTTKQMTIIRSGIKTIKRYMVYLMFISTFLAISYFLFYGIVINDSENLEYTKPIFNFLANYLAPDIVGDLKFQKTGLVLLMFNIPLVVIHIIATHVEKIIVKTNAKINSAKIAREKKEQQKRFLKQFSDIKYFAIVVSFDYTKGGSQITLKAINQLNIIMNTEIAAKLKFPKAIVAKQGVVSVSSKDFENYDKYFEKFLKVVAKVRAEIQEKYKVDIMPTITTDAYLEIPTNTKMVNTHFTIKGCNLKNRAITTNLFYKKYNFIGLNKYAGNSIGLYDQQMYQDELLDLNIVSKNLSEAMDKIAKIRDYNEDNN